MNISPDIMAAFVAGITIGALAMSIFKWKDDTSFQDIDDEANAKYDAERKMRRSEWIERHKGCCCKDASRNNSCKGMTNCSLRADHPERVNPK